MNVNIGELPPFDADRDAIHVAVVPAIAAVGLQAGQRVGIVGDMATPDGEVVGIVDPFLPGGVKAGERFWLCLLPNTVTGMRHHWSHPLFVDVHQGQRKPTKAESEAWLRQFARSADCPQFDVLIAAASGQAIPCVDPDYYGTYENDGECLFFSGRDAHGDIPDEFWDHVENFTGKPCPMRASHFSCSC